MVAASGRTRRELSGRTVEFAQAGGGASGVRHVSQVLPDVLARYGITPESLEQSAVAGRRERAPAAALELAGLGGNPAACAVGCW